MMLFIETLYADPLLKFLVNTTMKSFVIFAVAGLFAFCLRRKSAAVRGLVWNMAIIGCLIVPLFSLTLPKWKVNVLPQTPIKFETPQLTENAQDTATPVLITPNVSFPEKVASPQAAPTRSQQLQPVTNRSSLLPTIHWTNWVGIVWACVSVFFLARLITGIGGIWYISTRSKDFRSSIDQLHSSWNQQVSVRLSDRITMPMMWGFFRPVILLPTDAANWQTDRLRAVLLHETAHIKRWDWLMQTIAQIACATYWFNPFVWFAAHRMRIAAEQACDDQVLNTGYQSTDYARHLLDITRNVKMINTNSRAAVAMARSSKIEGRLRTVLTKNLNRHPMTKVAIGIGLILLACIAVPMGAIRFAQAVDPEETSKSQLTPSEDHSDKPANAKQIQKNVEICKQHLIEIGKAIQAYKREHGDFPEWLSDLYPEYLPDANLLLCPADDKGGKPIFLGNTDPEMPVSYGYQFHPGYREGTQRNRTVYGDVIPLARCRHHPNQEFDCLNLGFSFRVYPSSGVWQMTPWEMYENSKEAIATLGTSLQQQPDDIDIQNLYLLLVRHYIEIGQKKDAESLFNNFKSTGQPDSFQANLYLGDMLEAMNQNEEARTILEKLEKEYPNDHTVLEKLAEIHEKLGNAELAAEYQHKVDPTLGLVGKPMPDFSATDLDGKSISLQQYRGKVVLLDFWAVWCDPCTAEMPIVKRVYDTYKDQGFDIIGVSLDTEEKLLRNYLKENDIQWRQIFSGKGWYSPLVKQFDIHAIPAPWLIAKDGTLISHDARTPMLEWMVVKALKDKPTNPSEPTGKSLSDFEENLKTAGPDLERVIAEVPVQILSDDIDEAQEQKNIEICEQHLLEIGKAIQTYQKEHGDFPEWLSDLHPKYLPDANILLCPADEDGGKTYFLINKDPKMSMSYDYQFHPQYREQKTEERLMYGDVLPFVRCRHHEDQPFECHNLSFAFKVYWSSGVYTPDEMYETIDETIEALEKGLQRQADNESFFHFYTTLARLYIEVGREKDVESLVNRFKSVMRPNSLSDSFRLGSMLEITNRHKEVLKVFEKLEKRYPDNHHVLDKLARIHEKLGNSELAAEYRKKANPMSELVGKVVPDFTATDLDGKPISLQQYRGKVVLLDFWAVWCGPCISEMPNVKRVYNSYKDQGFDIIGVSLDTDDTRLRNYLKANDIPWRQIFSGQKWKSPLAKQYHIHSIPAPWLIARDGTLISRKARGFELERLVVEALKSTSTNQ